jgi:hypothetical protein
MKNSASSHFEQECGGNRRYFVQLQEVKDAKRILFCAKIMQGGQSLLSEAEKPQTPSHIQRLLVAERRAGAPIERARGTHCCLARALDRPDGRFSAKKVRRSSSLMKLIPHSFLEASKRPSDPSFWELHDDLRHLLTNLSGSSRTVRTVESRSRKRSRRL